MTMDEIKDAFEQQSHHCGIETKVRDWVVGQFGKQQSHHCGIETWASCAVSFVGLGSNRTIVGLKQVLLQLTFTEATAAIAPLWD